MFAGDSHGAVVSSDCGFAELDGQKCGKTTEHNTMFLVACFTSQQAKPNKNEKHSFFLCLTWGYGRTTEQRRT
jgi:hypothetical protein